MLPSVAHRPSRVSAHSSSDQINPYISTNITNIRDAKYIQPNHYPKLSRRNERSSAPGSGKQYNERPYLGLKSTLQHLAVPGIVHIKDAPFYSNQTKNTDQANNHPTDYDILTIIVGLCDCIAILCKRPTAGCAYTPYLQDFPF